MMPVISVGSLRTSGSTTLALVLSGVAAAADIPVVVIDAARHKDVADWSLKPGRPDCCMVEVARDETTLERLVRAARRHGDLCVVDAGDDPAMIRTGARLADRALIPVCFSPLSAYAALATERLIAVEGTQGRRGRDWAFVASAVAAVPSRVARTAQGMIARSPTPCLGVALMLRAAYEAPFPNGGTLFTLRDELVPDLDDARTEAAMLACEVGILGEAIDAARRPAFAAAA